MNKYFNVKRIGYLAGRTFAERWRGTLITSGVILGVLLLQTVVPLIFGESPSPEYYVYAIGALILWGSIEASTAFNSLYKKPENEAFLLLPASALEKTIVPLLYVSLVLPVFIVALIYLGSVISEGLTVLVLPGEGFAPLGIWNEGWLRMILYTIVGQSVFFLGSAWFKKSCWWKTFLSITILGLGIAFAGSGLIWVFFSDLMSHPFSFNSHDLNNLSVQFDNWESFAKGVTIFGKVLFFGVLAPFCWITAWLRIKEAQSSDGV